MRATAGFALLAALAVSALPAGGQEPDYLTPEEVEQAREIQEPNKRIELFLGFAELRLAAFEQAVPKAAALRPFELRDLLNDFIRSVDDTTDNVQRPLDHGGVELKQAREKVKAKVVAFHTRLETLAQSEAVKADEDLGYDLEDAMEAVDELTELAKTIPDGILPAKTPPAIEAEREEAKPTPGKPTLKRRTDKPKEDKP